MPEMTPHTSRTSLDDLLQANREQFDRVFSAQLRNAPAATAAPAAGPTSRPSVQILPSSDTPCPIR